MTVKSYVAEGNSNMADQIIICPHCNNEIPLTEAISRQIREELRKEVEAQTKEKEQELTKKEKALDIKENKLKESKESIEEQVNQKVKLEKEKLEKEAKKAAEKSVAIDIKDLHEQIKEKEKIIMEAQNKELELRKERRKLKEEKEAFELELTKKLDEERENIKEDVAKRIMEKHRLKDLEKDKQINDMKTQIEELQRKAEQGSQRLQGEVLELELEDILKANFQPDQIEPVPPGIKGADIIQKVHNQSGQYCGTIIWETKRTKAWNDKWITKLKEDQREKKAEIAVILTIAMPKQINNFGLISGVWVTNYNSIVGLAIALRVNLIQVANAKLATVGQKTKMEILYNYLAGPEFKQKVEGIVEAFVTLREDLEGEKRAMVKIWSKREKQIEKIMINTVEMYGGMQGIIGASMPQIKSLEMKELANEIVIGEIDNIE